MSHKKTLRLLLVEDNKEEIETYKDRIDIFKKNNDLEIELVVKDSLQKAQPFIADQFDAAIIDIRLKGDTGDEEPDGPILIREILENFRIPIFVHTGNKAFLDQFEGSKSTLFKTYVKGEVKFSEILKDIKLVFDSGITKIIGPKGQINEMLNSIFWHHIARQLDLSGPPAIKEEKLTRYIAAHLYEYLELDESGSLVNFSPEEVYIKPPIKNKIFTGHILKEKQSGEHFIVLTPACDLAQSKAPDIVIAPIESYSNFFTKDAYPDLFFNTENKKKDAEKKLETSMKEKRKCTKYYILPSSSSFQGGLINFQRIQSRKKDEIDEGYEKIASISYPFIKDIIARFSTYYSRQGAPDLDMPETHEKLLNHLNRST